MLWNKAIGAGGTAGAEEGWNISTASYVQSISVGDARPANIFFMPDGAKLYVVGSNSTRVREYNLSAPWDLSTATFLQSVYLGGSPFGLFFKPDGAKMYVVDRSTTTVREYNLSTPWDVSTASYFQNVAVAASRGLFFKPDGAKMYVVDQGGSVKEYNLSTPWNVSTASYFQDHSVAAQESIPLDVFFKPGGAKMYVTGISGDDVNEYNLSIPWDVSTSSYVQNFSVQTEESSPTGLFFKPDGMGMYVSGEASDNVNEYTVSA
jgi:DNA-binding beta-propeller fold protein YncE